MAGVYIHIPFCDSFCIYCGFYSEICHGENVVNRYIDALEKEISEKSDFFKGVVPSTIYFGGGTPSLLSVPQVGRIYQKVKETFFRDAPIVESTIEVNPDDITSDYALGLKEIGFNRISMGVQSFDDSHLRWMGRRHDAAGAIRAYHLLRQAGFENVSMDLIFGYRPVHLSWEQDIRQMLELRPEHISAYQLSVEPDSALERGGYEEMDAEYCRRQYELLQTLLTNAGYRQYEISNFALPGNESRHNSSYWTQEPYLGLGASAHSYTGVSRTVELTNFGRRSWNPADIREYGHAVGEFEDLTQENYIDETIMLGLRRAEGFDLDHLLPYLSERQRAALLGILGRFQQENLIIKKGQMIHLTPSSYFISDYVMSEICSVLI